MRDTTAIARVALAAALLPQIAGAAPMPRAWSEMNLDDVDPSPYAWVRPCRVREDSRRGVTRCEADLQHRPDKAPAKVIVEWFHEVTASTVLWFNCSPARATFRSYPNRMFVPFEGDPFEESSMASVRHSVNVRFLMTDHLDKSALERIGRDLLRKFEPYSLPCDAARSHAPESAGAGAGATATRPPVAGGAGSPVPGLSSDTHVIPEGNELGVLGQGPGEGRAAPSPRAHRGDGALPSVFPSGTELVSLHFWASPKVSQPTDWIALERRRYGHLVARELEYLQWDLRMRYRAGGAGKSFVVETVVFRGEREVLRFRSGTFPMRTDAEEIYTYGWGSEGGGFWSAGTYRFELRVEGELLASRLVTIQ